MIVRVNNRGPFVHNRLIDLSVGTAKALDFYGHGLARVRVEYVGRAPIEGSDDRMLLATLREGSPAPAPSTVMVASAKPFLPAVVSESREGPHPCRWNVRSRSARRPNRAVSALHRAETKPVNRVRRRSRPRSYRKGSRTEASVHSTPPSASRSVGLSRAHQSPLRPRPRRGLGLMSGRGLY